MLALMRPQGHAMPIHMLHSAVSTLRVSFAGVKNSWLIAFEAVRRFSISEAVRLEIIDSAIVRGV